MPSYDSRIQEAFRHPESEVRQLAVAYYAKSYARDEALLPLVLAAVQQYSRCQQGYLLLHEARPLSHSPTTVAWLVAELSQAHDLSDPGQDNYCLGLAELLQLAPPQWLQAEMAELPSFPEELRDPFRERLTMADWDWDTAWHTLHQLAEETNGGLTIDWRQLDRMEHLYEVLARHPQHAPWVLQGLEQRCAGEASALRKMLTLSLINVACRMRLVEAVPLILAYLQEDDLDIFEECMADLPRIGGDTTVAEIAARWPTAPLVFRGGATELLGFIHTPQALALCQKLFEEAEEPELTYALAHTLLNQCAEEAIAPVREYLGRSERDDNREERDLRYHLVAMTTILGMTFPEYDCWYQQAVQDSWGWPQGSPIRMRNRLRIEYGLKPIDRDFDFSWAKGDLAWQEEDLAVSSYDEPLPHLEPIHRDVFADVGRNDPCPCGSGKKYKKCCLHKPS